MEFLTNSMRYLTILQLHENEMLPFVTGKYARRIKTKCKKKLLRKKDDLFKMVRISEKRDQEKIRWGHDYVKEYW